MAKRTVKRHNLGVDRGLATNADPRNTAGKYLVQCENMDWWERFQGIGKMPGTITVSRVTNYPAAEEPLGLFDFNGFTPQNVLVKTQIAVYDTGVYLVDDDPMTPLQMPTLSVLPTDGVLFRSATFSNRLLLTGPTAKELTTGMLSWNGDSVADVGVLAPGERVTEISALFADPGDIEDSTDADSSAVGPEFVQFGAGGRRLDKVGTTSTEAYFSYEYDVGNQDWSLATDGLVYVYAYIPQSAFQVLDDQASVIIYASDDGYITADYYVFRIGSLTAGWNLLTLNTAAPTGVIGSAPAYADISHIRFTVRTKTTADTFAGVIFNYLHYTDPASGTAYKAVVAEGLNDTASWTAGSDGSRTLETGITIDGTAVAMQKLTGGSVSAYIDNTDSYNWSAVGGHVYLWLYVSTSAYQAMELTGTAFFAQYGNNDLSNSNTHAFLRSQLRVGWQLIDLNLTSPSTTSGTGAALATIARIRLQVVTEAAANTFDGVVFDALHYRTLGTEVVTGPITGTVTYVVTFVNSLGVESNAGDPSNSVSLTADYAILDEVPISPMDGIIERRIYRDLAGDGVYQYAGSLYDNVQTAFFDTVPAASLSTQSPPFLGSSNFDNGVPGRFYDIGVYGNRLVGIDADNRNVLRLSDVNSPDTWRLIDTLQCEEQLTKVRMHGSGFLVYSSDSTFYLDGDGVSRPFSFNRVSSTLGANNWRSVVEVKGSHFVWHEKKAYVVQSPGDPWYISGPVQDLFDQFDQTDPETSFVVHDLSRTRVMFWGLDQDGDRLCLFWQYGTRHESEVSGDGPGVDPTDIRNGAWGTITADNFIDDGVLATACAVEPDPTIYDTTGDVSEIWIQETTGIYALNVPGEANNVQGFGMAETEVAVPASVTFAAVPLGNGPDGRGHVRYIGVDAYASAATTWTASIAILSGADGAVITTITRSLALPQGHSSPRIVVGGGGYRGSWARLTLSNNTSDGVGVFKGPVRLYYVPRTASEGARSG